MSRTSKNTVQGDEAPEKTKREIIVEEVKFLLGLITFLFVFLNFVFGHFKIPSESMQPTLEVGDHLYVNKLAYGVSRHSLMLGMHKLPFFKDGRLFSKLPERGDVAVFRNPRTGIILIKRVVGLPGDLIETKQGRLYINDVVIDRIREDEFFYREHRGGVMQVTEYTENLPGEEASHQIYERSDFYQYDNRGPYRIPEGNLFLMGHRATNGPFRRFNSTRQSTCHHHIGLTCKVFDDFWRVLRWYKTGLVIKPPPIFIAPPVQTYLPRQIRLSVTGKDDNIRFHTIALRTIYDRGI